MVNRTRRPSVVNAINKTVGRIEDENVVLYGVLEFQGNPILQKELSYSVATTICVSLVNVTFVHESVMNFSVFKEALRCNTPNPVIRHMLIFLSML